MSKSIHIAIAAHKPYWTPSDSTYIPIQVGAIRSNKTINGFQRDDEGDSVSDLNPRYCELTALYWLWRNDSSDYKGLVHYRRYFAGSGEKGVASADDINALLDAAPIVLPNKRHYYISSVEQHYADTFSGEHIEALREVLSLESPEVLNSFNKHMRRRSAHIWNMCIMRSDIYHEWCSWLFPILKKTERMIDFDGMSAFEERVMGRLSERLLDPWIEANGYSFVECKVVSTEKVNWGKKISSYIMAKFAKKKYKKSF